VYYLNFKTIYFNFHYLPFDKAVRFPVLVSRNTKLRRVKGTIEITDPVRTGMIRIGTEEIGIYDRRHHRPVWENSGKVIFRGSAVIKYGAKIVVGPQGILTIGDQLRMASGSYIICYHSVTIGHSCRISWNTQILDTDFHRILDLQGNHLNPDSSIILGDHNWIGHSTTIAKGTELGEMVVVGSHSLLNKKYDGHHVILAGIPAKVVREGITWE
jgi:acetyltransferase-like isoleucine patch superfamily enzyme